MNPVTIIRGGSPVILGQPHCGTYVPEKIFAALNGTGRRLADTDWHIDRLYADLFEGATVVRANFHRYVIDPNRPADNARLYDNSNTTGLVPKTDFNGQPIWKSAPSDKDVSERIANFHTPYHRALGDEIARVRAAHGYALLLDCHSIRSEIPFLFDGRLPDLNIGTNSGRSCATDLEQAIIAAVQTQDRYSWVANGRFKGGWTTRYYGRPDEQVHAVQLELCQHLYLEAEKAPFNFDPVKAEALRPVIRNILSALNDAAGSLYKVG